VEVDAGVCDQVLDGNIGTTTRNQWSGYTSSRYRVNKPRVVRYFAFHTSKGRGFPSCASTTFSNADALMFYKTSQRMGRLVEYVYLRTVENWVLSTPTKKSKNGSISVSDAGDDGVTRRTWSAFEGGDWPRSSDSDWEAPMLGGHGHSTERIGPMWPSSRRKSEEQIENHLRP